MGNMLNHNMIREKKYFVLFSFLWRCKYLKGFDPKLDHSEQCQQENQYQSQYKYLTSETF